MNQSAKWIASGTDIGSVSPEFVKIVTVKTGVVRATAKVSAMGVYRFFINQQSIGNGVLMPGFTSYPHRIFYQTYDISDDLTVGENRLGILCGKGWALGCFGNNGAQPNNFADRIAAIAEVRIEYADGSVQSVLSDTDWDCYTSTILDSELYHGETVDTTAEIRYLGKAVEDLDPKPTLEEQSCGMIVEHEQLAPQAIITTPKGETVLDFGQNIAGYARFSVRGRRGDRIVVTHAEVLDRDGNFYTENMRKARNRNVYVLSGGDDVFQPSFTYQGFRYIRLDEYPAELKLESVRAVVIHSDMERTGSFSCGYAPLNQLYGNIVWGQRGNYVDIPTDCHQRDERLGWTADTQVFCRTAAINYDVEAFLEKWLRDMSLEQRSDGSICRVVPFYQRRLGGRVSAGWSDAATVVPWELYRAFGSREILEKYYPMMTKWVDYIHNFGDEEFLWVGGDHYGDWLALDAGEGQYVGATQKDLIASAYFAYSTMLTVKAGRVLGKDVRAYEELLKNIKRAFRQAFMKDGLPIVYPKADGLCESRPISNDTQTACSLILSFDLCEEQERAGVAARLVELIKQNDGLMTTGFIGTPLLLHALAKNGYVDVAYSLLLEDRAPSWLFSVKQGATTVWEHWDSIKEDGSFWSADMNSFNHYAYGSVFDWIFEYVGGISILDGGEGYARVRIAPVPHKALQFANVSIRTRHGELSVCWKYDGDAVDYTVTVPEGTVAEIALVGVNATVTAGTYTYRCAQNGSL